VHYIKQNTRIFVCTFLLVQTAVNHSIDFITVAARTLNFYRISLNCPIFSEKVTMFKVIAAFRLSRKIRRLYGLGKKNSARRLKAAACRVGSITFKMYSITQYKLHF